MADGNLLGAHAISMDKHGQESMNAIERKQTVQRLAVERTKGATRVAEIHLQHLPPGRPRHTRRDATQPIVIPFRSHAANEISAAQFFEKFWKIGGIVLPVAIQSNENGTRRGLNAGP